MPGKYGDMHRAAYRAYVTHDWETCVSTASRVAELLNGRADTLITVASCEARLGRFDAAMAHLKQAVANGYWVDITKDRDLTPLRAHRDWKEVVAQVNHNRVEFEKTLNLELLKFAAETRVDRKAPSDDVDVRSANRRRHVVEMLKAGEAHTARDFYNAAVALYGSRHVPYLQHAIEALRRAIELDPYFTQAWRLMGLCSDVLSWVRGEPQQFGTVLIRDDGLWLLAPVDTSFTDAQREAWYLPPLATSLAEVKRRNIASLTTFSK